MDRAKCVGKGLLRYISASAVLLTMRKLVLYMALEYFWYSSA
jgi:hypothetical protein